VYVQQGEVRGFLSVYPKHHIAGLFVDPDNQGSGLGSCLLDHVGQITHLDSVAMYSLNLRARQFYEGHGFRVLDISPTDGDGEPYALLRMGR
jgi:GNAT superfamily N-acetyltransferase